MLPDAIRVISDERDGRLDRYSLVDYGSVYTIQYDMKVRPFGHVERTSLLASRTQFTQVCRTRATREEPLFNRNEMQTGLAVQTTKDWIVEFGQVWARHRSTNEPDSDKPVADSDSGHHSGGHSSSINTAPAQPSSPHADADENEAVGPTKEARIKNAPRQPSDTPQRTYGNSQVIQGSASWRRPKANPRSRRREPRPSKLASEKVNHARSQTQYPHQNVDFVGLNLESSGAVSMRKQRSREQATFIERLRRNEELQEERDTRREQDLQNRLGCLRLTVQCVQFDSS